MKEVKTTCDYIFAPFAYKDRLSWYDRNMSANFSRQYVEIVVLTLTFIEGILNLKFDMEVEFTTTVIGMLVFLFLAYVCYSVNSFFNRYSEFQRERFVMIHDYIYGIKIENGFIKLQYIDRNNYIHQVDLPVKEYSVDVKKMKKMAGKLSRNESIYALFIHRVADRIDVLDDKFTLNKQNLFGDVYGRLRNEVSEFYPQENKNAKLRELARKIGAGKIEKQSPFYFQISARNWNERMFKDIQQVWREARKLES